ncbi:GNAT family N-acetyltransferase [Bacillus sp. NTK034]|uniref:GNAT family N-acetyltransferase n=1 Tax=Bacillus sp. NTK034 TaxID=2802176 RepID=UPI001A8CCEBB|nr:GNAT family N-acetyltransferase [Bacillus sp. NTK034]MBN8201676.1 GNAT family N-acetyltransferase [Bacillus sp. NTK034]
MKTTIVNGKTINAGMPELCAKKRADADQKMIKKDIKIVQISKDYETAAKELILKGFQERFGFIDHSLNPDLNCLTETYSAEGDFFLAGLIENELVCTGAITNVGKGECRLQRMSVKKEFRGQGIAGMMVRQLEDRARAAGYRKVVLETNMAWDSAVNLYKRCGYMEYYMEDEMIHLSKEI